MNIDRLLKYKNYFLIALLLLLTLTPSLFLFVKLRQSEEKLKNAVNLPSDETAAVVAEVSKLMQLPSDERPTVATITDKEKLSAQPFFAQAKNGDKVLIYTKAKKAILYDPLAKKIIDVAPVNTSSPSAETVQSSPTPSPLNFILYNGTSTVGLTKQFEIKLKQIIPNAQVMDRANAQKNDYQKTLLIDLNNDQPDQAQNLANQLGIAVSPLPPQETASKSADFLIILGQDNI